MVNQGIYECVENDYRKASQAILASRLSEYLGIVSYDKKRDRPGQKKHLPEKIVV
jgi:hypothetical protein